MNRRLRWALLIAGALAARAPAAAAPTAAFRVARLAYDLQSTFETNLAGAGNLSVQLSGRLVIVRGRAMDQLDFSAVRAVARKTGGASETYAAVINAVWVERDKGGQPARIGFGPTIDRGTRQLCEYVIAELPLAAPHAGAGPWRRVERDSTGIFEAEYRRDGDGFVRTKRAYQPQPGRPVLSVVESEQRLRLSPAGALVDLHGRERLRIGGINSETSSTFAATLRETARTPRPPEPPADLRWFAFGNASAIGQDERDSALLAGATLPDVLGAVRDSRGGDLFRAIARLAALARHDPATVVAIETEADSGRCPLPRLVAALLDAGTEPADALLARWLRARQRPERVSAVAGELLLRRPPHPVLIDALSELSADQASPERWHALFALGSGAALLADADPPRAQAIIQQLTRAEAAAADDERPNHLAALANTKSPEALPRLEARLKSAAAPVREAAALALGQMPDARATRLLDRIARTGADAGLRRAALRACSRRHDSSHCQTPRALALHDRDPTIRRAALDAVRADGGDARPLLRQMSESDPDPTLRGYATQLLGKIAAAPSTPAMKWQATNH